MADQKLSEPQPHPTSHVLNPPSTGTCPHLTASHLSVNLDCNLNRSSTVGFVYRLRMDNLQSLLVCENHAAAVKRISFAPDASDRFATLSSDCTIRVWYDGLGSGSEVNPHPHSHPVLALTLALALALTYIHILHHAPTPTP